MTAPRDGEHRSCTALLEALPDTLTGQERREVEPADVTAAAWGDPPIVLRCGVREPPARRPTSRCDLIEGVGWFAEQRMDGFRFTTLGREVGVQVEVPFDYEPAGAVLVALADPVTSTVRRVEPCV